MHDKNFNIRSISTMFFSEKQGLEQDKPAVLARGEFYFATDTGTIFYGDKDGIEQPIPLANATRSAQQLIFRIVNPNAVAYPIIIEDNTFGTVLTWTYAYDGHIGHYQIDSSIPLFIDTYKLDIKLIPRADTEPYTWVQRAVSSTKLQIDMLPLASGEYGDHDLRIEIYGTTLASPILQSANFIRTGTLAERDAWIPPSGYGIFICSDDNAQYYFVNNAWK